MTDSDRQFTGSMAEVYDECLAPLIFDQYAADLARRIAVLDPDSVLELAAGSGVVPRAVAPVLRASARYVVSDLSPPMLERAAAMQPHADQIEWIPADAAHLPFEHGAFDVVLCQFGVMFFPDRAAAYAEARRVLRPGGVLIYSMWDRIEENDFAFVVTQALAEIFPTEPPRFLERTPHGQHDPQVFRSELDRAGFGSVDIAAVDEVSTAEAPDIPAVAYCHGTPLRTEIEGASGPDLATATTHAASAMRDRFGSGPVSGRIRAFIISAS